MKFSPYYTHVSAICKCGSARILCANNLFRAKSRQVSCGCYKHAPFNQRQDIVPPILNRPLKVGDKIGWFTVTEIRHPMCSGPRKMVA